MFLCCGRFFFLFLNEVNNLQHVVCRLVSQTLCSYSLRSGRLGSLRLHLSSESEESARLLLHQEPEEQQRPKVTNDLRRQTAEEQRTFILTL